MLRAKMQTTQQNSKRYAYKTPPILPLLGTQYEWLAFKYHPRILVHNTAAARCSCSM